MKSDASSRLNTRVTALENAGGGGVKTKNIVIDRGTVSLSKSSYPKLLFVSPIDGAYNTDYPYSTYTYSSVFYSDGNYWEILIYKVIFGNGGSISFEMISGAYSDPVNVIIGYTS